MDKNAIISVKGMQVGSTEKDERIELITEGTFVKNDDAYYITYDESEVTGMSGTSTTLKVDNDIITVTRIGEVNSEFIFQRGEKHMCHYDIGIGAFTVGVFTRSMTIDINESGGEIAVNYSIEINNNNTGNNDFKMVIKERN